MLSIEILQKELDSYNKALKKSIIAHGSCVISPETHRIHIKNLHPKIEHLKKSIKILSDAFKSE